MKIEFEESSGNIFADLLGIKQAEVSHLLNGHFNRFTTDKLLEFLKRMNQKVTIQISPHKQESFA